MPACLRPSWPAYLKVSVDDPVHVTVVDAFQDLLNAVRRIRLRVELARHNVLEQLASGHAENEREKKQSKVTIRHSTLKNTFIPTVSCIYEVILLTDLTVTIVQ